MPEWYTKKTLGSLADTMAERFGEREALVFNEERYTFGEVLERINEVARGLIQLGIEPGDHVALWMVNRPEWIFAMYALAKIGAVQVPVNTRFRTHDLAYLLKQSDARYLIVQDVSGPVNYLKMVREVVKLPASGVSVEDPDYPEMRTIVMLGASGWKVDMLMGAVAHRINGIRNTSIVNAADPEAQEQTSRFMRLLELMRTLQDADAWVMPIEADGGWQRVYLYNVVSKDGPIHETWLELCKLLDLDPDAPKFRVRQSPVQLGKDEIAVFTRSLLRVMVEVSDRFIPPAGDVGAGLVSSRTEDTENEIAPPLIDILNSRLPPVNSFVTVFYRGHWFYISRTDGNSKKAFALLADLFSLQSGVWSAALPVVTVPAGGG